MRIACCVCQPNSFHHLAWLQASKNILDGRTEAHFQELVCLVEDKGIEGLHVAGEPVVFQQIKKPRKTNATNDTSLAWRISNVCVVSHDKLFWRERGSFKILRRIASLAISLPTLFARAWKDYLSSGLKHRMVCLKDFQHAKGVVMLKGKGRKNTFPGWPPRCPGIRS